MYCVRKVVDDLYWVGGNDHRLALFENIHPIPRGVSYNSYLLLDEKTVLFDTVDWSICRQFLENVEHVLDGRDLDYLVINHMEPDHGASIEEILLRYPNVTIISTEKSIMLMHQFGFDVDDKTMTVKAIPFASVNITSSSWKLLWSIGRKQWLALIQPMAFSSLPMPLAPLVP